MSAYIILRATPHPRRINELETRMRTVMGVMAQKGATNSRLFRNLMGANAGDIGIGFEFENFQKAMNAFHEARQDPIFMEVNKKRWDDPAGNIYGPVVMRDVYEPMDITAPVMVGRTYRMSRKNLPEAIDIIKEIDEMSDHKVSGLVPVMHSQMDTVYAMYHFESLSSAGKYIDEVGMSARFQELVVKANELGTLVRSSMHIKI